MLNFFLFPSCNHACKDKTACRHLWSVACIILHELSKRPFHSCREGFEKPPPQSKKRTGLDPDTKSDFLSKPKDKTKPKTSAARSDHTLEDLETIHKRTNVTDSLKLPEGRRLKLEPVPSAKTKSKPRPNFDIKFADLKDDKPSAYSYDLKDIDEDADDLPEAHEILTLQHLSTKSSLSPETNYSSSEIDALIRDAPLEMTTTQKDNMPERLGTRPSRPLADTPASSVKRSREHHDVLPPAKHARYKDPMKARQRSYSPILISSRDQVCFIRRVY